MHPVSFVLSQHAESAALLWLRRDRAVSEPHYALAHLAKLDGQLDGHLDGLRIAGDAGWEIAAEQLRWQEPGEAFPAAVLAFERGDENRVDRLFGSAADSRESSRALASALAWLPFDRARHHVDRLLRAGAAPLRRLGIAAAALHRRDPGKPLGEWLDDTDCLLRARVFRATGELGRIDLTPRVREHLVDAAPDCRFAAAWAGALMSDDHQAVATLRQIAEAAESNSVAAAQLAVRRMMPDEAKDWVLKLSKPTSAATAPPGGAEEKHERLAVMGAGALGLPGLVPWLLERMTKPPLARVAGEAIAMITGLDLAEQDLDARRPDTFAAGPTEDASDEDVELDPDENLPWPNPDKISAWWWTNGRLFEPQTRHLVGKPMSVEWLKEVLRNGYQRQRVAAAMELAIRQPGQPLFEVRAAGFRQREWLD